MADDRIMYGVFESDGRPLGFYPTDIYPPQEDGSLNERIPSGAVPVSDTDWQMLVSKQPLARYVNGAVVIGDEPPPSALVQMAPPPPNPMDEIKTMLADILKRVATLEKRR